MLALISLIFECPPLCFTLHVSHRREVITKSRGKFSRTQKCCKNKTKVTCQLSLNFQIQNKISAKYISESNTFSFSCRNKGMTPPQNSNKNIHTEAHSAYLMLQYAQTHISFTNNLVINPKDFSS